MVKCYAPGQLFRSCHVHDTFEVTNCSLTFSLSQGSKILVLFKSDTLYFEKNSGLISIYIQALEAMDGKMTPAAQVQYQDWQQVTQVRRLIRFELKYRRSCIENSIENRGDPITISFADVIRILLNNSGSDSPFKVVFSGVNH